MANKTISQTGSDNASPASTSYVELETSGGLSEHATLANIRTLFKSLYDTLYQAYDADLDTWATKTAPSGTVVGDTDTQTLSAKTLTKPVINGSDPTAATYSPASGSQTVTLDCSANNLHFVQGNNSGTAITFAISNITNNQVIMVSVTQGSTTLSTIAGWFSTIRWAGGAAPTFTATLNKRDVFGFIRTGSGTYDGFVIGQNI